MNDPKAVFLSYASEDAAAARRICEALRTAGVEVWLDQEGGLEHGDEWDAKIRRQIKECVFFLPVISANTEARHEGYFRIEWELGAERAMGFAHNVPFILPIVIDETNEVVALVPERFRRVQWTRLPDGVVPAEVQARFVRLWKDRVAGSAGPIARSASVVAESASPYGATASAAPWAAVAEEKSVAVLPFANLSADAENEYFSDGMTEEIINVLVQVRDLRVAARTSSFAFKGKADDLRTIAAKLNVRTVLEGSVRKAGNRIRITVQLVNAADGFHLWSDRFDRNLDDIFAVQEEIAQAIVDKLKAKLAAGADHVLVKAPTENLEAYQLYLQGRYFWNQRGAGLVKGLKCFEAALALDPNYALAHTGVADSYTLLTFYGFVRASDVSARARTAAERAVALDPNLAEAHAALAWVRFSFERNLPVARLEFERAIELKPSYIPARYWLASLCVAYRSYDEAVRIDEEAVRLEPHSLFANVHLGWMLLVAGRAEEAIRRLHYVMELDSNFLLAHWLLGQALITLDRREEGLAELQIALTLSRRIPMVVAGVGSALAYFGRKDEARAAVAELLQRAQTEYVAAYWLAILHAFLDDEPAAMAWLEKAYAECDASLPYLAADPPVFMCTGFPQNRLNPQARADFIKRIGIIY